MFEEFIADQSENSAFRLELKSPAAKIVLHGHCHQKAMNVMSSVERVLAMLPDTAVEKVESSCCGMAGAFGYGMDTHEISLQMGEMDLLPTVRAADSDSIIVADGTSCRHQIRDNTNRSPLHVALLLDLALKQDA